MPSNLNLVPFIDLFSTMIIFLIVTAVFDQLAAVTINMGAEDKPAEAVPKTPVKKIEGSLKVTIKEDVIELFDSGSRVIVNKNAEGNYDMAPVAEFVAAVRERNPEKRDVVISANDKSAYRELIAVMDEFLGQSFTELIVTGTGS